VGGQRNMCHREDQKEPLLPPMIFFFVAPHARSSAADDGAPTGGELDGTDRQSPRLLTAVLLADLGRSTASPNHRYHNCQDYDSSASPPPSGTSSGHSRMACSRRRQRSWCPNRRPLSHRLF
jgi:hypothetical protein